MLLSSFNPSRGPEVLDNSNLQSPNRYHILLHFYIPVPNGYDFLGTLEFFACFSIFFQILAAGPILPASRVQARPGQWARASEGYWPKGSRNTWSGCHQFYLDSNCFRFILLIHILSHADFLRCAANHWGTTLNRWVGHSQRASNAHHAWPTIPLDLRAWALSAISVLHPSCVYASTSTFRTFRTFRAFNIFRSPQALTEAWKLAIGPPASLC